MLEKLLLLSSLKGTVIISAVVLLIRTVIWIIYSTVNGVYAVCTSSQLNVVSVINLITVEKLLNTQIQKQNPPRHVQKNKNQGRYLVLSCKDFFFLKKFFLASLQIEFRMLSSSEPLLKKEESRKY